MGLLERLEWVNDYSKKRCRSLFWRVRAALKKALKNGGKQRLKFQYDPSSYALNFDDGFCAAKKFIGDARLMELTDINNTTTTLVYVLWEYETTGRTIYEEMDIDFSKYL
ncbi:unnamed protein product [Sphenostylis stenocarpa]|uniref:Uncharacterized protein n=1 Tax=Sphenostylis stenocarpa TaxID=92480 RepID=A0AA86SJ49_9FABA|nr:unnamed protein product [Sphenostylis stenocarpa]